MLHGRDRARPLPPQGRHDRAAARARARSTCTPSRLKLSAGAKQPGRRKGAAQAPLALICGAKTDDDDDDEDDDDDDEEEDDARRRGRRRGGAHFDDARAATARGGARSSRVGGALSLSREGGSGGPLPRRRGRRRRGRAAVAARARRAAQPRRAPEKDLLRRGPSPSSFLLLLHRPPARAPFDDECEDEHSSRPTQEVIALLDAKSRRGATCARRPKRENRVAIALAGRVVGSTPPAALARGARLAERHRGGGARPAPATSRRGGAMRSGARSTASSRCVSDPRAAAGRAREKGRRAPGGVCVGRRSAGLDGGRRLRGRARARARARARGRRRRERGLAASPRRARPPTARGRAPSTR